MGTKKHTAILFTRAFVVLIMAVSAASAEQFIVDDIGVAGYSTIQNAVDDANNGDMIIVSSGTYIENVVVNKQLSIVSESGDPDDTIIKAANLREHVFNITADNVTISGFTIKNARYGTWDKPPAGIYLYGVRETIISNNSLSNNEIGIRMYDSSNNQLINNNASNNEDGIRLYRSSNNVLDYNTVSHNYESGFGIYHSICNEFINNIASDNDDGIFLSESINNRLIKNNVSNNKVGINIFIGNENNELKYNTISNNKYGISFHHYNNNTTLYNNIMLNNKEDIHEMSSGTPLIIKYLLPFILLSIVISLILLVPVIKGYRTTPKYQIIPGEGIKTFTGKVIRFEDIKNLEIAPNSAWRVGIPSFTLDLKVNLPGYYAGTHYIFGLGKVKMICTRWFGPLVIITTDKIKYAVSPNNPKQFIEEIKTYLDLRSQ